MENRIMETHKDLVPWGAKSFYEHLKGKCAIKVTLEKCREVLKSFLTLKIYNRKILKVQDMYRPMKLENS
jgi:hypothetical protein